MTGRSPHRTVAAVCYCTAAGLVAVALAVLARRLVGPENWGVPLGIGLAAVVLAGLAGDRVIAVLAPIRERSPFPMTFPLEPPNHLADQTDRRGRGDHAGKNPGQPWHVSLSEETGRH
ncbi:hypothetical protein CLV40_121100 [Actinokineospora auranticolor]|uniref:Uncharacterized protein n=1 Tax=Actinokineospora auranticolor TaxID=155976 RepID=A0A2S6GGH0_9PSEU|nr:hypothetical protein CLV40_121100 [Actinokineospora auranticolor]